MLIKKLHDQKTYTLHLTPYTLHLTPYTLLYPPRFAGPYFFALYPPYQVHDADENEKEWSEESKERYEFGSIEFSHWPSQSFRYDVHAWHHQQCKEERKYQSEYDGPA